MLQTPLKCEANINKFCLKSSGFRFQILKTENLIEELSLKTETKKPDYLERVQQSAV
jgi:hypothetical protein